VVVETRTVPVAGGREVSQQNRNMSGCHLLRLSR
jgi:hypothetical protein